ALHHRHLVPSGGDQLSVVVADQARVGRLAMRPRQQAVCERLRRLRQDDARTVETLHQPVALDALDRVARRDRWKRRPGLPGRGAIPIRPRRRSRRLRASRQSSWAREARPVPRRASWPAGSAKIIRPAEVWITEVTTAVTVWLMRRSPFWITTMVPSSRLPTPCPGSLPSRATVTMISSPGMATGRMA